MDRRHALTLVAAAPLTLALAACPAGPKIPADSDAVFADVAAAIASAEAMVNFVEALGVVDADTIAQARAIIAKARDYLAKAKAALGSGLWKDLADAALHILTGIVFGALAAPAAKGGPAAAPKPTLTLRKTAASEA